MQTEGFRAFSLRSPPRGRGAMLRAGVLPFPGASQTKSRARRREGERRPRGTFPLPAAGGRRNAFPAPRGDKGGLRASGPCRRSSPPAHGGPAPGGERGRGAGGLKVTPGDAGRPPALLSPGTCRRCRRPAPADPPPCPCPRRPTGRPARRSPCCRGGGPRTRHWGWRAPGRRAPPWLALPAPAPLQAHAAARGGPAAPASSRPGGDAASRWWCRPPARPALPSRPRQRPAPLPLPALWAPSSPLRRSPTPRGADYATHRAPRSPPGGLPRGAGRGARWGAWFPRTAPVTENSWSAAAPGATAAARVRGR